MSQETPHTSNETGLEVLADVEAGRNDALQQIAGALAGHIFMRERHEEIDHIIKVGVMSSHLGIVDDLRDLEANL